MLSQVVMVEREKLAPCITCPLCNKLLREATTISECLHSFCRKCIYKKINDEELDYCPVCNINLGCSPLEKLRADYSLECLKTKLFGSKRKKVKPDVPSVKLPVRKREISLSSLVSSPPKVVEATQTVPRLSKRLKAIARTHPALRESVAIDTENPVDFHENSPEDLCKIAEAKRQLSDPALKEAEVVKSTDKEQISEPNVDGDVNNLDRSSLGSVKATKLQALRQKSAAAQPIVRFSSKCDGRFNPIWFSLIASDDQDGDSPLPQISSCYLRVKDGSLRVSTIRKYVAQKLGLVNEIEVEIRLQGQPIGSMVQLHELVEWWVQILPGLTEQMHTRVGSSAKDFVMVLSYARKSVSQSP